MDSGIINIKKIKIIYKGLKKIGGAIISFIIYCIYRKNRRVKTLKRLKNYSGHNIRKNRIYIIKNIIGRK